MSGGIARLDKSGVTVHSPPPPPWDLEAQVLAEINSLRANARSSGDRAPPEFVRRWREKALENVHSEWKEKLASLDCAGNRANSERVGGKKERTAVLKHHTNSDKQCFGFGIR
ncbi:hypothetical protein B5X24_HaOG210742 [Helicoverpa armigera]|uniref:Uncharacterized protein n=1 Tax=Helicoverpa armigera TaxID=29058 RepID=A0A2W1BIM3_HELAM|nr:hypothetical protein B5X24_HaOG210742 [Helicoverpa armigera]